MTPEKEIQAEDKKAFIMQYYGQRVLHVPNTHTWFGNDPNEPYLIDYSQVSGHHISSGYLSLRSIESLTDEHAIKIATIILFHSRIGFEGRISREKDCIVVYDKGKYDGDQVHILHNGFEICRRTEGKYEDCPYEIAQEVIDTLRSWGYLLPFREYSVEQILSLGWAQYQGGGE